MVKKTSSDRRSTSRCPRAARAECLQHQSVDALAVSGSIGRWWELAAYPGLNSGSGSLQSDLSERVQARMIEWFISVLGRSSQSADTAAAAESTADGYSLSVQRFDHATVPAGNKFSELYGECESLGGLKRRWRRPG